MSLKDWERDVINRQRNIVFPDTVLNEGRFYRNIASGRAVRTLGQRLSLLFIVLFFVSMLSLFLAASIGNALSHQRTGNILSHQSDPGLVLWDFWPPIPLVGILLFWIFLAVKGLFPPPEPRRRRRRGYRSSSIQ